MKFEFTQPVDHPREQVYTVLKDKLADLVPLIPNIADLKELSREDLGNSESKIVNEWHGDPGAAPKLLRPFIKPEFQIWKDYAHWHDNDFLVNWHFEANFLSDLYDCGGTNYVEEDGKGASVIRLTGNLQTYPERLSAVPKVLANRIRPVFEQWVIGLVSPNLAEMPKAVVKYLDKN